MFWKVLIPLELNSPCAKNWTCVLSGISAVVAWVHAAFDGACAQTRITIRVIGVDVGAGNVVLVLPPQLSSIVVITKASTGATTKHLFCHIKHPAMPWQLQRCQAEPHENELLPEDFVLRDWPGRPGADLKARVGQKKERRTPKEGGGSPMPANSRPALRRIPFGCREELATEVRCSDDCCQIRTQKIRR
jgi:hypothetical protein